MKRLPVVRRNATAEILEPKTTRDRLAQLEQDQRNADHCFVAAFASVVDLRFRLDKLEDLVAEHTRKAWARASDRGKIRRKPPQRLKLKPRREWPSPAEIAPRRPFDPPARKARARR
jgi:hypothetical protein